LRNQGGPFLKKMSFQFAIPSARLQPFIKQYWAFENVLARDCEHRQRIIATGLPELIFYFGNRPTSDKRTLEGNVILNGQHNDFYDLIVTDKISLLSVTFHPHGLSQFLKIPLNEIQNQSVFLEYINKELSQQLEHKLTESEDFSERIKIIETYFLQLLTKHKSPDENRRMSHLVELIKSTKGIVSIDFLASSSCLSRKQFERKFMATIGLSPKQYLKVIRFQNALHINQTSQMSNLTELALEAGYYDQSHFINETKELTGQSPKKLFETDEIVSDFFQ
jgi:AraC-like DNA-binding protein